jgi:hypothetical protein
VLPADILPQNRWDKLIAADLTAEMERHLGDKVASIPEMRRFLAVKGYREMREIIERDIMGKSGNDALRALMLALRRYALERPGLSAATFRTPETDCPDWRDAQMQLAGVVFAVFAQLGVCGEEAHHALRILRSIVRGFVLHEMNASFLDPLEHEQTYEIAIRMFTEGLGLLRTQSAMVA